MVIILQAEARTAAAKDLGLSYSITQLHSLRSRADPLASLLASGDHWLSLCERVTALHQESAACSQLAIELSSCNAKVRACRKAAAPESKDAQTALHALLQSRDVARVTWAQTCARLLKQLPALSAPDGKATGAQAALEATRAFQGRVAQAAAAAGLPPPSPPECAANLCWVQTVRARRAALVEQQVAQAETRQRTNAVAKLASSSFLATADRLASLSELALPRLELPASFHPGAPAAFAAAVEAENVQHKQTQAASDAWLQAFHGLIVHISARLNHLLHVARTLPHTLERAKKLEALQDGLKERYAHFVNSKRALKRKIAKVENPDSDVEMDEDEQKANKAELERKLREELSAFHRDWAVLLTDAKSERPELLQRAWCALQPWAQGKKGEAKLAEWVEAMLTHLDSRGLEKPDLSLEAYSDRKMLPADGANHLVWAATSPSGTRVALKRFTPRPQDQAALKKVRGRRAVERIWRE